MLQYYSVLPSIPKRRSTEKLTTVPPGVRSGAKVADVPAWSSCLIPDHDELVVDPSAAPVLLIDGHYIIYRSFHGMPHLSAPDGTPVGALLGFCNVINKLVRSATILLKRAGIAPFPICHVVNLLSRDCLHLVQVLLFLSIHRGYPWHYSW